MILTIFCPKNRRSTRGITGRYDKNPGAQNKIKKACCTEHKRATTKNAKTSGRCSCFGTLRMKKNIAVEVREKSTKV